MPPRTSKTFSFGTFRAKRSAALLAYRKVRCAALLPLHPEPHSKREGFSRPLVLLLLLMLLAGVGWAALQRQALYDDWRLHGYTPPPAVSSLATQDTMNDQARRIFYVNHPAIVNGNAFSTACPPSKSEQTIVLGCYHGGQAGIYVLSVNDPLLDGVEQVTAAHEMLHAAYDRLSASDRRQVDAMLEDYYQHDLHDQRILDTIAAYRKTEPNDVVNEMHSIFGTEIAVLPSNLETYYKRYFTNRAQIAALAARYQNEFTSRQAVIDKDDATLTALLAQITAQESDLKAKLTVINAQQAKLLQLRDSNVAAYNAAVPAYNQLVDNYNNEAAQIRAQINQYNQLVVSRNAIALKKDQLVRELTNTTAPINK